MTFHNTMLVTGGVPWVKKGVSIAPSIASPTPFDRLPEQSENIDIAPTVAWLLGLGRADADFPDYAERGKGFDGRVLTEAYAVRRRPGRIAADDVRPFLVSSRGPQGRGIP